MAATLIDAFLIELGLDASKFNKGQAAAVEQFEKTKKETTRAAREIEQQFNSVNQSIEGLHRSLLALFAVFTGGRTLKALIGDLTDSGAATSRLAGNIGMSVKELDSFGRAVERMGGSSADAQASFQKFADQYATFQTTGQLGDLPRIIGQLNTFGHVSVDVTKPLGKQIDVIADGLERIAKTDPVKAQFLARQIFGNTGMANLALQGSRKMREALKEASQGALTPAQTEVMKKLQDAVNTLKQAFESVGNAIVEAIGPKTTELFKSLAKWIQDNIGLVKDLALAFGAAAAAMLVLKGAFVLSSLAMTMTPLGKILLLMSLLAGAVLYLHKEWESVGPYVNDTIDGWKSRFWEMIDAIKNGGPRLLDAFKQGFSDAFDWLAQKLEWLWNRVPGHELLSGLWERTKSGLAWLNKEFGIGSAQAHEYEGNPAAEDYDSAGRRRAPGHGRRRVMERGATQDRRSIEHQRERREGSTPRENIPFPTTPKQKQIEKEAERAFPRQGIPTEEQFGRNNFGAPHFNLNAAQRAEMAAGIRKTAKGLGISPEYLAAVISFETGGTMDPWKKGPTTKWGTHRGLIQWGEPQARQYGVSKNSTITQQLDAVGRYLRDRGVKPGMSLEQIYGAVLAGGTSDAVLDRRDKFGTSPRSGAQRMWHSAHRNALAALERSNPIAKRNTAQKDTSSGRNAIMHRGDRGALNGASLPSFARMGTIAQNATTHNNSHTVTNNSNSNSAHINAVNINVPHADPNTIATGLDAAIRRQMYSGMTNYGAK